MEIERIIDIVEQYYNLPAGTIIGRKRTKGVATARKQAVALCRSKTRHSWAEIEDVFNKVFTHNVNDVKIPFGLHWKIFWSR